MQRKIKSESTTSIKPPEAAAVQTGSTTIPANDPTGRIAIDFHSAEFNCVDDLTDSSRNVQSFEPLGDVITADMRHQIERRQSQVAVDPCTHDQTPAKKTERETIEADVEVEAIDGPPPLNVVAEGRILIIDTDARRAGECSTRLGAQGLECTVVLTKAGPEKDPVSRQAFWGPLRADTLSVSGAFGGFAAAATMNGNQKPLADWLSEKDLSFDLVLDLQSKPSYAGELLPMGYYAPGTDPIKLEEALAEMPEMRGRFVKPQFTAFLDARCIHGLSRKRDCRRCLDICPFGAIQSADRKITVNPYLCQGCGACALACPTDAIRLLEPSRDDLLETIRQTIQSGWADRDQPPAVVVSDSEMAGEADDGRIHLRVEQIGHAGLELLLETVAFGAGRIAVACGPQTPSGIRKVLEGQVQMADAVLQGLGMPAGIVRFADRINGGVKAGPTAPYRPALPAARDALSLTSDGRTGVRLAVQRLYVQFGSKQPRLEMPEGFPFGAVAVDSAACTLCMACAVACPSGALLASNDAPRLTFIESRCHQCGLCKDACPEDAIRLLPRILCDPAAVNAPAVLREAEPFRCIVCGVPFATQAMIDRMQDKLTGHWMYSAERQLRRLRMCRTCRTRDALTSQDVNAWNR